MLCPHFVLGVVPLLTHLRLPTAFSVHVNRPRNVAVMVENKNQVDN